MRLSIDMVSIPEARNLEDVKFGQIPSADSTHRIGRMRGEMPPHPQVRRHSSDQPKLTADLRRERIAPPITPKPPSIIAQLAGSGTPAANAWNSDIA